MTDDPAIVVRQSSEVLSSDLQGELVLLKPETGDCYSLQGVGALLWQTAARPSTMDQLAEAVCSRFEVTPEQALDDIRRFVSEMIDEELIVREPMA